MRISLYTFAHVCPMERFANLNITAYRFLYKVQLFAQMNRGASERATERSKEQAALAIALNVMLREERDLRLQTITQARLKGDARLPSSEITQQWRLCILNRIKCNLFIRRRDRSRAVWCSQTATSPIYLPGREANEAELTAIETRRNSIFVACWQVAVPGKSQKLHYYPAVTGLSASIMRADVLSWRRLRCNGEIPRHGNWQVHHVRRNTGPEASYSSPK